MKIETIDKEIRIADISQDLILFADQKHSLEISDKGNGVINVSYDFQDYSFFNGRVIHIKRSQVIPTFFDRVRMMAVKFIMPKEMYI